ncbi:hypothetical protein RA8P1_00079 (plasmid) [Variovorax sp. RA8]|nr:hypothetical protein RA8P1_00079 [Variovorax sp. RA8]
MGRTAGGKSFLDAQMLVNLRDAPTIILTDAQNIVESGLDGLREVHASLMRGILPDDQLSATRKTTRVRIAGTQYIPSDGVAASCWRLQVRLSGTGPYHRSNR